MIISLCCSLQLLINAISGLYLSFSQYGPLMICSNVVNVPSFVLSCKSHD